MERKLTQSEKQILSSIEKKIDFNNYQEGQLYRLLCSYAYIPVDEVLKAKTLVDIKEIAKKKKTFKEMIIQTCKKCGYWEILEREIKFFGNTNIGKISPEEILETNSLEQLKKKAKELKGREEEIKSINIRG